jgi:hypothetical protein
MTLNGESHASAATPTAADRYLETIDLPPLCPVSAHDAPVCQVSPVPPNDGQATSVEYILFRIGWADAMRASCDAYVRNTTVTMTVDGQPRSLVTLPCQHVVNFNGSGGPGWVTDARYLSPPLPPGTHTVAAQVVYNAAVP